MPAGSRVLFSFNDVQAWIAKRVAAAREERREQHRKVAAKAEKKAAIKQALYVVTERTKRKQ